MSTTTLAPHPHRGYAVTKYSGHSAHGAVSFDATITLDGKTIGTVSQSGRGGCHLHRFNGQPERLAFEAYAAEFAPGQFEADDRLTDRLCDVATLNRLRTAIPFLLASDVDFFTAGAYRTLTGKPTFDQLLAGLQEARPDARIWVKDRSEFVPVADLVSA